jgi:hypothetical protein
MTSYFKLVPLLALFLSQPFHVYSSPTGTHNATISRRQEDYIPMCKSCFDFCASEVMLTFNSLLPLGITVVSNRLVFSAQFAFIAYNRVERLLVIPLSFAEL